MAITSLLGDVAASLYGKRPGQVNIDSKVFQLHYRFTTFLFLAFSFLSTADSLLGEPISCACQHCELAGISATVINTHCWVTGTYTLTAPTHDASSRRPPFDQGFYGLGTPTADHQRKYHMYYQWVPFALLVQGVLFYVPHWMWEINEDGRIEALARELRMPTTDRHVLQARVTQLTVYVADTLGSYDGYFLRFIVCDLLNIVNVIANLAFTNRFLNGEFLSYGPRCLEYFSGGSSQATRVSPMSVTFPKLTKCQFQYFGSSGTLQNIDAICVLALNIFNEKIYLLLWFWLVALCVITVAVFCFRSVLMLVRDFRAPFFQRRACTVHVADIDDIVLNLRVGDFFFLSLLAKNLDITAFRMFLAQMAELIRSQRRKQPPVAVTSAKQPRRRQHQPLLAAQEAGSPMEEETPAVVVRRQPLAPPPLASRQRLSSQSQSRS